MGRDLVIDRMNIFIFVDLRILVDYRHDDCLGNHIALEPQAIAIVEVGGKFEKVKNMNGCVAS